DDRISAILLDVGVHPLVDEAALLVVDIVAGQRAKQIVIERRTAGGTAVRGGPVHLLHDFWDGAHTLRHDLAADVIMAEAGAFAHRLWPGLHVIAERQRQEIFDQPGAATTARRRLAGRAHCV